MLGLPKPMSEELSPIENDLFWCVENTTHSEERSGVDNTWMLDSRPLCEDHERIKQIHVRADNTGTDQQIIQATSSSARSIQRNNAAEEVDERTPLLRPFTERTISGVTSPQGEDNRGNEATTSEHSQPTVYNQIRSRTQNEDRSNWRRVMSGWLGYWFRCLKPRARAHNRDGS